MTKLAEVYESVSGDIRETIASIVYGEASTIVDIFYDELLADPRAQAFIDHEKVRTQLKHSLNSWLKELFSLQAAEQIDALMQRQLKVGEVHARIDVPMKLVDDAMQIVKRELFKRLIDSSLSREALAIAVIFTNRVLDESLSRINQSYLNRTVDNERNVQTLRIKMLGSDLVVECERVRSELFDWMRQILFNVHMTEERVSCRLPEIHKSTFGLWITHKAAFYFGHAPEVKGMEEQLDQINAQVVSIEAISQDRRGELSDAMQRLNDEVNKASWLLDNLIKRLSSEQQEMDPLTKLLGRRYMNSVLQMETKVSIAKDMRYAALLVDLDDFKGINDTHGHQAGDFVLREAANLILQSVRSTDFAFRYGGEEFLIVLTDMTSEVSQHKAEVMRHAFETHEFKVEGGGTVKVTVSIGVAVHSGHPDYKTVLKAADKALYEAKHTGKNRVVLAT